MRFVFCPFCRFRTEEGKQLCSTCGQRVRTKLQDDTKPQAQQPGWERFKLLLGLSPDLSTDPSPVPHQGRSLNTGERKQ